MSNTKAKFTEGSLTRHVTIMTLAAAIGLFMIFSVDLVDMFFIARLKNDALVAAVGFSGAILYFFTSLAIGVSIATGVLVARAIGQNAPNRAAHYATNTSIVGIALSTIFSLLALIFLDPLLHAVGARGAAAEAARAYLWILLPSSPFVAMSLILNAVLRAYGDAKRMMYRMLAGGIVNAILDPILIFGFDMGLQGAAIATVVARFTMFILILLPIIRIYNGLAWPSWKYFIRDLSEIRAMVPATILSTISTPFASGILTRFMAPYGESAVAGMAIIGRLTPVFFAVIFSLSGAIGPIIGQNFSAQKPERVRETYSVALKFTLIYVVSVSLLLFLIRPWIFDAFNAQGDTLMLLMLFCGPLSLGFFFKGTVFISTASLNNLRYPYYSALINWGRDTFGLYGSLLIFSHFFGAKGVLLGEIATAFLFATLSYIFVQKILRDDLDPDRDPKPLWPSSSNKAPV